MSTLHHAGGSNTRLCQTGMALHYTEMGMKTFKVGDKVTIRQWDDIALAELEAN